MTSLDTHSDAPPLRDSQLVGLIRQACAEHAGRVAVRAAGGTRTFGEVWAAARELAGELLERGLQPGDVVGLWAVKDVHLLAGMVGIMAAGGAYLPLDPALPSDRLAWLIGDADPVMLVAAPDAAGQAARLGCPVVTVGGPGGQSSGRQSSGRQPASLRFSGRLGAEGPGDAAYVIYTSGSTGRPKGVVVERQGVVNLLEGMIADLGLRPGDVFVGTAPLSFDASVPNLLLPLVTGGTLCLPSPEVARDPWAIAALVDEVGADVLKCSNSVLRMLCDIDWPGRPGLTVVTGGETLPPAVARTILGRVGQLWNYYGPTETTISSLRTPVTADDTEPVPIGWPMPGVDVRVLGPDRTPVAPGQVGELWISGRGVARGYLNDPGRTAELFVDLDDRHGELVRTYRTGDLVRERPDGALVMLGRADHQIKIQGFRVELAEIEARLAEHPAIVQAVVVVHRTARGDDRLVAYVHTTDPGPDPGALRDFAARLLPAWMVPTAIVRVDSYPVTPGGKVDRRALAELPLDTVGDRPGPVITDPVQRDVAALVADVLGLPPEQMRADDEFLALGGQSILAVELMGAISRRLGARLPLSTLVTAPSIADLALAVEAARAGLPRPALVPLRPGDGTALVLIHDGTGDLLSFHELLDALPPGGPVWGLQLPGADRAQPVPFDLDGLVTSYMAEVAAVCPDGPFVLAGYSFGGLLAYLMAARMADGGHPPELVALLDTAPPRQLLGPWRPMERSTAGQAPGLRGRLHRGRLRLRDAGDQLRYRTWRLVVMPLWVRRGRVVPARLHDPARVLHTALVGHGPFPPYAGRVAQWWGDHQDNVPPERMTAAWDSVVTRRIEAHVTAGPDVSHRGFLKGRCARWVADGLAAELHRPPALPGEGVPVDDQRGQGQPVVALGEIRPPAASAVGKP